MKHISDILKQYANGEDQHFKFYAFVTPPATDEHYGWAKECGYTHMQIFYNPPNTPEAMEQSVRMCEKYGLKAIWLGENFVAEDRPYAANPAFDGIYVDEPLSIGDLEKLSRELDVFQARYPDKAFYVNTVQSRGKSWEVYSRFFKDEFLSKANRKVVSGDTYPLREPNSQGETMKSFLEDVRAIGQLAADSGSEMYFFVQTIAMHGEGWPHPARRPSTEDIRFLHYVIASCGATGFAHFCYMSPGRPPYEKGEFMEQDYACIHPEGYRTELWYSAQTVMQEFKRFENIFLKFHWKGILPVSGSMSEAENRNFADLTQHISSHSYLKQIQAQEDLIVGCFEDDEGNVGFTMVNFTDPYDGKTNCVKAAFACNAPIAVIREGQTEVVTLKSGVFETQLKPGEGQFIILPKSEAARIGFYTREEAEPSYLFPPKSYIWKEDFSKNNMVDTYNVYGNGNSHFEFIEEGYPEGGSGRVVRLYTTTKKEKDWASYKFYLPDIPFNPNQKLVLKMYITSGGFTANASLDFMVHSNPGVKVNTLERFGRWTWFEIPLAKIANEACSPLKWIHLCLGSGIPFGTVAYIDEITLCDI